MSTPSSFNDQMDALRRNRSDARKKKDVDLEVQALLAIAQLATDNRRYDIADDTFAEAEVVSGKSAAAANRLPEILGRRGLLYRRMKRFPEALQFLARAADSARSTGDIAACARWVSSEGNVHRLAGNLDVAESRYLNALDLYESLGAAGIGGVATQEGQLGLIALERGDNRSAEYAYRRAVEIAQSAGEHATVATFGANCANALSRRRRYHAAWEMYGIAMAAAGRAGDQENVVAVAEQWAVSRRKAQLYGEAADILLDAAARVSNAFERFNLVYSAVDDLAFAGQWDRVRDEAARALAILADLPVKDEVREHLLTQARNADQAIADRSREYKDDTGATALDALIPTYMARYEKAGDAYGMADMAHLVSDVRWALGKDIENGWQDLLTNAPLSHRVIGDAMLALCEKGEAERSLELSQRLKGLPFALSLLHTVERTPNLSPEARAYLDALENLRAVVAELRRRASPDMFQRSRRVRAAGEGLLEAGEYLRDRDRILHARLGGIIQPQDLIDAFPADSPIAVLDVCMTSGGMVVHVMARVGERVQVTATLSRHLTAEHLGKLANAWNRANVSPDPLAGTVSPELRYIIRELHNRLFCSLARQLADLGVTQVVIIPDPFTRQLPLHLAEVCGKEFRRKDGSSSKAEFFCELFPVEYAPCLQAVAASQHQRRPAAIERVLSLADAKEDLPAARFSSRALRRFMPPEIDFVERVGDDAKVGAISDNVGSSDVLILGTHGEFNFGEPEQSFLELADGRWSQADISRTAFTRNQAVMLAACKVGAAKPGDDPAASGIPGALLSSGASFVLAALWPVEDLSMGVLLERFMNHLRHAGLRPAAALFRAIQNIRSMSRKEVIDQCQAVMQHMNDDGSADRLLESYLDLDALAIRFEKSGDRPFASPEVWGGVVVVGSGWSSPAGAIVANSPAAIELILEREETSELLRQGKTREARMAITKLLKTADGVERARLLEQLAVAVAGSARPECRKTATDEALEILDDAAFVAKGELSEQLLRNIGATRSKILLYREG